jgi:hypothetical protein
MGGTAGQRGLPGFGTKGAVTGLNAPQQLKIQAVQPVQATQPTQPIQRLQAMPPGGPFTLGNHKTTTLVPGAPTLPQNPYANAAWRRQTFGPKR